MPVSVGDRLGPYEILAAIGAGGMGEVYRANDSRLHRDVAIKVAAAQFDERSAREARLAASLNHPNVCHIYDVGPNYLVMELVEGPTLAERLRQGPVALDEAVGIALQIAEALAAAHEKGIVHRDLKPANIKVRSDGTVKVLDFGLAKVTEETRPIGSPESSPTITLEAATRAGSVLGTAAYMAPEQARGKPVDKRADIWAFGVVLYEMLVGQRLFQGETISDTLAAVLTKEPDFARVPPRAEHLLRRCLEKDPKQRLRDIGDARFLLEERTQAAIPVSMPAGRGGLAWKVAAGAFALVSLVALVFLWLSTRHTPSAVLRLSVDLGDDASVIPIRGGPMALSPDGSRIVFITGQQMVKSRLALRRLDQANALPLAGTEGVEAPFFSPDGKSIAFFADGKLKKMDIAGGAPVTLCDAPSQREGSWGDDDNIVFAATNLGGLSRVSANGGTPQPVTELDRKRGEDTHRYPQVLPGAHAVLFTNSPDDTGEGTVEVQSFQTGQRKTLVQRGAYGRYLPSGHLVYYHRGTLFAAPMNSGGLQLTGPAVPVLEDVDFHPGTGTAGFTFSQSGIFAYAATRPEDQLRPIAVMDEQGKLDLLPVPKARYGRPRMSPDGTRMAVTVADGIGSNIWIYEWQSHRFSRLPFGSGNSDFPVWTGDSKFVVFSSDSQTSGPGIYCMRADGAGAPQRWVDGVRIFPRSISPQTTRLLYDVPQGRDAALWMLPLDASDSAAPKPGTPQSFGRTFEAVFSPDGRWVAYEGGKSGTPEIFVRPFPDDGGPWQVSSGGYRPAWSRGGHELFYLGLPHFRIMAASYSVAGDSFTPASPHRFNDIRVENFDVMPDGKHVVAVTAAEPKDVTHATFLLNFMDDLQRRVPAGR